MLDKEILEKYDKEKMYAIYDKWPEIAKQAYDFSHKQIEYTGINHIVFAGMGGSGTIGDIFSAILSKTNIHVTNVKGYVLPKTVDSNTLVITTSVSGNTEETLTILNSASKIDCKLIAFSAGGQMEKICLEKEIEFRKIERIHSPRASFVNFLYSMLKILQPILSIKTSDIYESINKMNKLQKNIFSDNLSKKNNALMLANWINGIPLIYYPFGLQSAAIRLKNCLQENGKNHAITEDIVEACHNGIVAWEKKSNVNPILISGHDDYIKTKERLQILKDYFEINQIDYRVISSGEGSILSKLTYLIYLFDYTSIYYAVISKINPSPVHSIDFIKKKMLET
ncbi:MAG: SIS domain-containing protein [Candidatus Nitrosopumilus sp. Bin_571-38]